METLKEKQYSACFEAEPVTLGPMASEAYRRDPKHLGFTLARYKFVSKMLAGKRKVAEIGCGDAFGSRVVSDAVEYLDLFDFDPAWEQFARAATGCQFRTNDIVRDHLPSCYEAIYMLDVLEHVRPFDEPAVMANVCRSLDRDGIFIVGCPSLESQAYASEQSRIGHVNCRSGDDLRAAMSAHFLQVFLFGMNDEILHVGFAPMCQYQLALCVGQRNWSWR